MSVNTGTKIDDASYGLLGENTNSKKSSSILLYLTAICASLSIVSVGANFVWTSPVIWKLKSNNTNVNPLGQPTSTYQVALIAGLEPLGGLMSPIFLSKCCDVIGRRKTILLLSSLMMSADIVLAFSTHIWMYYVTRFAIGLCEGGALAAVSVFLSEISEDHNRGIIGCFLGISIPLGCLYGYVLGPLFSVKVFTLLCSLPVIINILGCLLFISETPYYLASRGDKVGSMKSLRKIRNKTPNEIEREYEMILRILKETSSRKEGSWSDLFRVKSVRKGFLIAVGVTFLPQISGISVVLSFAGPIFDAAGATLSGDMVAILIGLMKFCGSLMTITVIDNLGRRPLLIISSLGVSISNFVLGLFFFLKSTNYSLVQDILWLPIVSVLAYIISYALGLGVIPGAMMSELFPSNLKSKTSSACCCICLALSFVITIIFPITNDFLGPSWCIWLFSFSSFLGFIFVYFVVPEIKGKSLLEVQELLSK